MGEDMVARSPNGPHFVGSTATMPRMVALMRETLGLSDGEIQRLVSDNPRAVLEQTG